MAASRMPAWTWGWPVLAWVVLLATWLVTTAGLFQLAAGVVLIATVLAAVYHAEVVAHRVGEPFGTLVLALAVTIIETALIVSVMLSSTAEKAGLARDTVFAAVMIVCNGIVGFCLLAGGARHHEQGFHLQGASAALAVLGAIATLTLILPGTGVTGAGGALDLPNLIFVAVASLVLYGAFLFVQTIRHRDYFLPVDTGDAEAHAPPPRARTALFSGGLLVVSLVAIVALAKTLTPAVEFGIAYLHLPEAVVGIVIAALVLMPEGLAATRAARNNRLQTSLNLALGSVLACIGLTVPTVVAVSILFGLPLELGLDRLDQGLLVLTLFLSVITLGTGRTTVLQGIVHLVVFAAFLFFAVVP